MKSKSKSKSRKSTKKTGGFQPILHKNNKPTDSSNKRHKSRRASKSSKSRSYNTPTPIYPLLK